MCVEEISHTLHTHTRALTHVLGWVTNLLVARWCYYFCATTATESRRTAKCRFIHIVIDLL